MDSWEEWQVLGERVREARVAAQLNQEDLATRIGVERTALVKIEAGSRRVSAMELFRLADALDVPTSYFVAQPRAAAVSRRTTLVDDPDQAERTRWRLDTALDAHARDVEQLVGYGLLATPDHGLPRSAVTSAEGARQLARDARIVAACGDDPVGSLGDCCELFGLYLLVLDQDTDGAAVFVDGPGGFGAAVIGGRREPGRRRWTAAHELGHHLMGDEYHADVGVHSSRDEREKFIDVFAGEFLLPADGLRRRWMTHDCSDERSRLIRIAAEFRASWTAVVDAAQRAELLSDDSAHQLRADRPVKGDFLAVVGSEPMEDLQVGTTGRHWRQAVAEAYHRGVITAARAVELLHGALDQDELPAVAGPAA
ncbi:MAG: ImmA/IrrE family metallo-endopeptidase [Pseudonocardiaceae bacterium]|nr:ImmA/IrrE family metallo-endopeptidase [Pseudonocardiaceae bacterium]